MSELRKKIRLNHLIKVFLFFSLFSLGISFQYSAAQIATAPTKSDAQSQKSPENTAMLQKQKISELERKIYELKTAQNAYGEIPANTAKATEALANSMAQFTLVTGVLMVVITVGGIIISLGLFGKIRRNFASQDDRIDKILQNQHEMISDKFQILSHKMNSESKENIERVDLELRREYSSRLSKKIDVIAREHEEDIREIYKIAQAILSDNGDENQNIAQNMREYTNLMYYSHGLLSHDSSQVMLSALHLKAMASNEDDTFKKSLLKFVRFLNNRGRFDLGHSDLEKSLEELCIACKGRLYERKAT